MEPFAGGGIHSVRAASSGKYKAVFVGEADRNVRAIWRCYADDSLHGKVYEEIERLIYNLDGVLFSWEEEHFDVNPGAIFLCRIVKAYSRSRDVSKHRFWMALVRHAMTEYPAFLDSAAHLFAALDSWWHAMTEMFDSESLSLPRRAAISLFVRYVTFGGVIRRSGGSGKLNVKYTFCRLPMLYRWQYRFPALPSGTKLEVYSDWKACVEAAIASGLTFNALIDPPYWVPYTPGTSRRGTGGLTPAYALHDPHGDDFGLCLDAVRLVANAAQSFSICNYWSPPLSYAIGSVLIEAQREYVATNFGSMSAINKSRVAKTKNQEYAWISKGKAQDFGDTELVKTLIVTGVLEEVW